MINILYLLFWILSAQTWSPTVIGTQKTLYKLFKIQVNIIKKNPQKKVRKNNVTKQRLNNSPKENDALLDVVKIDGEGPENRNELRYVSELRMHDSWQDLQFSTIFMYLWHYSACMSPFSPYFENKSPLGDCKSATDRYIPSRKLLKK